MAILEQLRAQAPAALGVSEVARAVGLSKATCFLILQSLQRGHFVLQNPTDKTYTLGPALIGLGNAAAGDTLAVEAARAVIPALAARTGFTIAVARRVTHLRMAIVARAESPRPFQISLGVGQSFPLSPPYGVAFLAWADSAEVETWLAATAAAGFGLTSAADQAAYRAALERAQQRGYTYNLRAAGESAAGLAEVRDWLTRAVAVGLDDRTPEQIDAFVAAVRRLAELPPEHRPSAGMAVPVPIVSISAPVFDRTSHVTLILTLYGFAAEIAPERVPELGQHVQQAAAAVTHRIGGLPPARFAPLPTPA